MTADGGDDEAIRAAVEALAKEGGAVSPKWETKYVAKLACGCVVGGKTCASRVRVGSHGQWCEEHGGFQVFVDYIDNQPVRL